MKINVLKSSLVSSVALSLWTASAANAGVIAWSTIADNPFGEHNIYVMNDDGSNKRLIVSRESIPNLGGGSNRMPAISPDGTKVAFSRWVDNTYYFDIFVVNTDGTGLRRVTQNQNLDFYPSWSPDGSKLVFTVGQDIMTVNADGTGQSVLFHTQGGELQNPNWSPDSSKILFSEVSGLVEGGNKSSIYTINTDGTGLTALLDDSSFNAHPSWSSNGQHIVFASFYNGTGFGDLYKMNADGSAITALTRTGDNSYPVFDGQGNVIFTSSRDGNYEIYSLSADGTTVTRLTNTEGDLSGAGEDIEPAWGVKAPAINDYYVFKTTGPHSSLYVSASGVLSNDLDVNSGTVAMLVSGPKYGTLTFNADGSFLYEPSPAFMGQKVDTFTYSISDGQLTSNIATVTITRKD